LFEEQFMRSAIAACGCVMSLMMLTPAARSEEEKKDLAQQVQQIFTVRCTECHGEKVARPKGGFNYVADLKRLAADKDYIVPGKSKDSALWQMIDEGEMPPAKAKNGPLTDDEKKLIQLWIDTLVSPKDTPPTSQPKAGKADASFAPPAGLSAIIAALVAAFLYERTARRKRGV
jgi:mono/diheme cytochrome c family protein